MPGFRSSFPKEWANKKPEKPVDKLNRSLEHISIKSLRELSRFIVVSRILWGDLMTPLSCKDGKPKHGSERECSKGQGQQVAAWQVLLDYSEKKKISVGSQHNSGPHIHQCKEVPLLETFRLWLM